MTILLHLMLFPTCQRKLSAASYIGAELYISKGKRPLRQVSKRLRFMGKLLRIQPRCAPNMGTGISRAGVAFHTE